LASFSSLTGQVRLGSALFEKNNSHPMDDAGKNTQPGVLPTFYLLLGYVKSAFMDRH
jgi:hypothetical protein